MKCSYCGYENKLTNKFCENCGAELVPEDTQAEVTASDTEDFAPDLPDLDKETGADTDDKETAAMPVSDVVPEIGDENEYRQPADTDNSPQQYDFYQGAAVPPVPPKKKHSKLGIAVLILGFLGLGSRVFGLIAICLGVYDFVKNKDKKHVLVIIGMVLAVLGILIGSVNKSGSGSGERGKAESVTEAPSKPETAADNTPTVQPSATPTPTPEPVPAQKEERNGFDTATNQVTQIGNCTVEIPVYYGENRGENGSLWYSLNDGNGVILNIGFTAVNLSEEEFNNQKDEIILKLMSSYGSYEVDLEQSRPNEHRFSGKVKTDNNYVAADSGAEVVYVQGNMYILVLIQADNTQYDYFADFEKISASLKINDTGEGDGQETGDVPAEEGNEEAQGTEGTAEGRPEDEIDPSFKQAMDDYEAFFDEYVEFMQRYKENPSDFSILAELADMMQREADMMTSLENMKEDDLTTAELAYYMEVYSRILNKLASVY